MADAGEAVLVTLTVGSLFSGIGGLDLGLERAGMTVRWQVENDAYCQRVLAKHWPDVPRYGDIKELDPHALEPVDLICGGFPCHDISQAGERRGITGERSGLWVEFARVVRHLRPRFVLVENVGDLAVRGLSTVLGDLAAIGYDAEWQSIPAAALGAPHRRERLFIVAYPDSPSGRSTARNAESRVGRTPVLVGSAQPGGRSGDVPNANGQRLERSGVSQREGRPAVPDSHWSRPRTFGQGPRPSGQWAPEPRLGRVVDGPPTELDRARLRALGNAVVPQVAEYVGRRIVEAAA